MPYWLSREAIGSGLAREEIDTGSLSRASQFADASRKYLDADATRYVHLMDGGIADNLGMRSLINIMMVVTSDQSTGNRIDLTRIRRILLISADGQAINSASTARAAEPVQPWPDLQCRLGHPDRQL